MVFISIMVVAIVLVVLFVLVKFPQICFFDSCFRIIPFEFVQQINFWVLFLSWILVQVFFIFVYVRIGRFAVRVVRSGRNIFEKFWDLALRVFKND